MYNSRKLAGKHLHVCGKVRSEIPVRPRETETRKGEPPFSWKLSRTALIWAPEFQSSRKLGPCLYLRLASREFMRALLDTGPTRTFCTPKSPFDDSLLKDFLFFFRQDANNWKLFVEEFGQYSKCPTMVKQYQ